MDVGGTGCVGVDGLIDLFDALGYTLSMEDAILLMKRTREPSLQPKGMALCSGSWGTGIDAVPLHFYHAHTVMHCSTQHRSTPYAYSKPWKM